MINLGSAARYVRESLGLTQIEAARELKITNVYLSKIESGKVSPSTDIVDRYFTVWGIDLHMTAVTMFSDESRIPEAVRPSLIKLRKAWADQVQKSLEKHANRS